MHGYEREIFPPAYSLNEGKKKKKEARKERRKTRKLPIVKKYLADTFFVKL